MTVFDNVAFGLRVKHTPKDEIKKLVESALSRMQIGEYAGRYPSELSGGQHLACWFLDRRQFAAADTDRVEQFVRPAEGFDVHHAVEG